MPQATWIKSSIEIRFSGSTPLPSLLSPPSLSQCAQKDAIPYSQEALRQDLTRVRVAWEDAQSSRNRDAIYGYLTAVYGLVAWWAAEGQEINRARRALRSQRLEVSGLEDPFAAIIRCTADPAKADKRTRSKWSRVMRYAAMYKPNSNRLDRFIKSKGGINACAARFSRCLGRDAAKVNLNTKVKLRLICHLKIEADELAHKASRIKILRKNPRKWLVEFRFVHGKGFCGFDIVRADSFMDPKWSIRLPYLDFSLVRSHKAYDKKGYKNLIRDFRNLYFDGRNLTKKRCEVFFGNDDNFL